MPTPEYDDKDWPLFRVVVPRADMSDEEFTHFLRTVDGLFLRGDKFGLVMDARAAPPLSASRRQLIGKHANAATARYPGLLAGTAIVLASALQRGIFTAIQWVLRGRQHTRAFATLAEAEAWLLERLRGSGERRPLASGE